MNTAMRTVPKNCASAQDVDSDDLTAARLRLADVAVMAGRAAVSSDPREILIAVAVLERGAGGARKEAA